MARRFQYGAMTLRITVIAPGTPTTVKVDGRLTSDEVPELRRVCAEVAGRLVLDLSDLASADRPGGSVLRALRANGAELVNVSPVVHILLDRQSHDAAN